MFVVVAIGVFEQQRRVVRAAGEGVAVGDLEVVEARERRDGDHHRKAAISQPTDSRSAAGRRCEALALLAAWSSGMRTAYRSTTCMWSVGSDRG